MPGEGASNSRTGGGKRTGFLRQEPTICQKNWWTCQNDPKVKVGFSPRMSQIPTNHVARSEIRAAVDLAIQIIYTVDAYFDGSAMVDQSTTTERGPARYVCPETEDALGHGTMS
jgi:hypothetical protein